MRESCTYGSVGVRGGNEPLYPEKIITVNDKELEITLARQDIDFEL